MGCYKSLLSDLNILHKHFRVHGDLTFNNVVLDLGNNSMHLLDFNLTRKPFSDDKEWQFITMMADAHLINNQYHFYDEIPNNVYSFCDDVYAVSIIGSKLFPELFDVSCHYDGDAHYVVTEIITNNAMKIQNSTTHTNSILTLIKSLNTNNRTLRSTCADAYEYCELIYHAWETLNDDTLNIYISDTIKHKNITVDDVIHGHLKPTI